MQTNALSPDSTSDSKRAASFCADVSQRTQIEIQGPDHVSFLHNLCTQNVKQQAVGSIAEAFFLNVQGKILVHVHLWRSVDAILIEGEAGQAETLLAHLDRYRIREKLSLVHRPQETTSLLLVGEAAERSLDGLAPGAAALAPNTHRTLAGASGSLLVGRIPFAPSPAFLVKFPAARREEILARLTQSGVVLGTDADVECARLEAGFPAFGRDITSDNLAQEVDRNATAIHFTKGCYLGQETVARIDALGHVNRMLVGLRCQGDAPAPLTPLVHDSVQVGHITSATVSPRFGIIALGYVRRGKNAAGTQLEYIGGRAEVANLPFTLLPKPSR